MQLILVRKAWCIKFQVPKGTTHAVVISKVGNALELEIKIGPNALKRVTD